ncbi:hypothetical protein [Spirosoma sp. KNUC1025]|nr:hypothetical protein LN737_08780 [Spirosoma sp. KNUC1025]
MKNLQRVLNSTVLRIFIKDNNSDPKQTAWQAFRFSEQALKIIAVA